MNVTSLKSPYNPMSSSSPPGNELMPGIQGQISLISQAGTVFSSTNTGLKAFSSDDGRGHASSSPHCLSLGIS